ncbi:hypothetical protein [Mongoliibacter ruber]|nr:hypothetical protein [Mongoliibacter ruber]
MKKTGAFKNDSIKIEMLGKGNRVIINGEIIEDNSLVKKELGVEGEIVQKGEGNQVKLESFSGKSDTSSNSVTIIQKGKGNKVKINNH